MRLLTLSLTALLALAVFTPVNAASTLPVEAPVSAPAQAPASAAQSLSALRKYLAQGLAIASKNDILSAYQIAVAANDSELANIAALIAIARPDLVDNIKEISRTLPTADEKDVLAKIQAAITEPTGDQLAALATDSGTAPAAGPEAGDGVEGSAQ